MTKVPEIVEPVPLIAIPERLGLAVRVQLYVTPDTLFGLVIKISAISIPPQTVCVNKLTATLGFGFTVTETEVEVDGQPDAEEAVMMNVVV